METHDLQALVAQIPLLELDKDTSSETMKSSIRRLGKFDDGFVSLVKFSGETPWELHRDGNEFLVILEGELLITLLSANDSTEVLVTKGKTCIIPRNVWHRSQAKSTVTLLAVLASEHGPVSTASDPRIDN